MRKQFLLLSGLLLFILPRLGAQTITGFSRTDTIPVYDNSQQLLNPWAGGINFSMFSEIDLNLDGIMDLFVFDRSGNKITTYLNTGTPNQPDYRVAPQYVSRFPLLHDWAILRDYNCDGKMDIFTYSVVGFSIYKNVSSIANGLQFQLVDYLVYTDRSPNSTHYMGNLFVSQIDIPAIRDVDGDGDLDVLTFQNGGNQVEYHKNMSMELYGVCDSIRYQAESNCWGYFTENGSNAQIITNTTCPSIPLQDASSGEYSSQHTDLHTGSCLECLDIDDNGQQDLLVGDIGSMEIALLHNDGTTANAHIDQVDQNYPSYDTPVSKNIFNCGFHLDVNNDGLKDLIICPNAQGSSENFHSVMYYRNTTSNDSVRVTYVQDDFLQETMLDFGEGAYPVFFDYDNDGDKDLFVGNHGYYSTSPPYHSEIALLKNIGSATNPVYSLMTRDFAGIYASGAGIFHMAPTFGDLDGDGDKDMLVGDFDGKLHFFRKDPGPNDNFVLAQMNYQGIDVGAYAAPQLIDVNRDGLLDLVIGEETGNLNYYQNTGTAANPVFTLVTTLFGGHMVNQPGWTTGHSMPCMYDDNGNYVLLVGSERGYVYRYDNIDGNLSGTFTVTDSMYVSSFEGGSLGVAVADLNNDGLRDVVIGNYAGGISFFWGDINVSTGQQYTAAGSSFSLYPNPATEQLTIGFPQEFTETKTLTIRDLAGKTILQKTLAQSITTIDVSMLPAGVYFCTVTRPDGFTANNRFIITR